VIGAGISRRRFFKAFLVTLKPSNVQITSSYLPPIFILVPLAAGSHTFPPLESIDCPET
jgi:hypothetical protein